MSRNAPKPYPLVDDRGRPLGNQDELACVVCAGTEFVERKAQLNTPMASFLNIDWANTTALCQVCTRCGYIHWFLR